MSYTRGHVTHEHREALVWLAAVLAFAIALTVLVATQGSPMTADSAATIDSVTGRLSVVSETAP